MFKISPKVIPLKITQLSLEGKIIFESLAISKIVCLPLLTLIPNNVIKELKQIQKTFLRGKKTAKIKCNTLCNDFNDDGLKIAALKCSRK